MTTDELRAEVHRLADLDLDDESLRRAASELSPEKALTRVPESSWSTDGVRLEQLRQDEERRR